MRKAFTLVELLVIIAIIAVLIALLIPAFNRATNENVQYGVGGITETRCINGFKCIVGPRGHVTQLIGQDGKPVLCVEQ